MTPTHAPATIEIIGLRDLRLALHEYLFGLSAQLLGSTMGGQDTQQFIELSINGVELDGLVWGIKTGLGGDSPIEGMVVTVAVWIDDSDVDHSVIPQGHNNENPVFFTLRITCMSAPHYEKEITYEIEDALLQSDK